MTCLSYRSRPNSFQGRDPSKPISALDAKNTVIEADKAGLVHTATECGYCNCCGDCCYLFLARNERGFGRIWPKTAHIASFSANLCGSCGSCLKKCSFNALMLYKVKVAFNDNLCAGCGLRATSCRKGALNVTTMKEG
jgi:ferredoxin